MLIRPAILLIFLFFASYAVQNGGYAIDQVNDKDKSDIQVIHFRHSTGVVFPAAYAKQLSPHDATKSGYFTPDSNLIKSIDKNIYEQYSIAWKRFNDRNLDQNIELSKAASDTAELEKAKAQRPEIDKRFEKMFLKEQRNLIYYDKQYLGYIAADGEKIILIQFLNFRRDPDHLKKFLTKSWITGWHGWFETNVRYMRYHVDKNLLTVNDDL